MVKAIALTGLAAVLSGCAARAPTWAGKVEWPAEDSARPVGHPMEAGAALAAAGVIHELVKTQPFPDLFRGCSSPEQGLDVAVFTGPTSGLYYVVLHQRFNRCGGPAVRVLDGWYAYAVTPQGEVVAEAPLPQGEASTKPPPDVGAPHPAATSSGMDTGAPDRTVEPDPPLPPSDASGHPAPSAPPPPPPAPVPGP